MTLRRKTILIMGMTLVVLLVALFVSSRLILLASFARLEEQYVRENVGRALNALSDDVSALDTTVGDWAPWDDTYTFMQDGNGAYVQSNLVDSTFVQLRLNLMLFVKPGGEVAFGKGFDLQKEQELPLLPDLEGHLAADSVLLQHADAEEPVAGIIMLSEGPMLIASHPILTSQNTGPARGVLLMGRFLDADEIARLGETTRLSIAVQRLSASEMPLDFQEAVHALSVENPLVVRPLNQQTTAGYALLQDIAGRPDLVLRVDLPREIYGQGQMSLRYALLWLLLIGLVFGVVIILVVERMVLWPLEKLSAGVGGITAQGDPAGRVQVEGRDELSGLARTINEMLAKLEQSQAERREATEALRESEARYRAIVEDQTELICRSRTDGTITFVNDAHCRYFGRSRQELLGQSFMPLIPEEDQAKVRDCISSLGCDRPVATIEHRAIAPGGEIRWQQWTDRAIFDQQDRLVEVQAVGRDVTETRKMEEELLKVRKLESIGVLAGGIAHDFNNVLTAILGSFSLARLAAGATGEVLEYLTQAEKASLRARDLTQQLLTFSRGGAPIKKTASIAELIKDSAGFVLSGSNVRCQYAMADGLWPVEADEGQISQAIHNLLLNAQQAMPSGGTVEVRCENVALHDETAIPLPDGRYVKIAIEDHGIGIPEEHLLKIFDPYFTTKQKGNGLGLATAYSIVKRHSGHISVESRLGVATTFTIYLPASESAIWKQPDASRPLPTGKGKILVMDDEEMVRQVCGSMCKHLGYEVDQAGDGTAAIERYQQAMAAGQRYAAVIMDLTVPGGMGGKEAVRRLLESDPEARVVASSGYANDPIMANFRDYGFRNYVAKPYYLEELGRVLQETIGQEGDEVTG
jgi:PAS domain S-box-containing protein